MDIYLPSGMNHRSERDAFSSTSALLRARQAPRMVPARPRTGDRDVVDVLTLALVGHLPSSLHG